jgi:hypothetical protein
MTTTTPKRPEGLRRRADSGGGPLLNPAHPSKKLWSESLFNRLSRMSLFNAGAASRVGELMEEAFGTKNPLLAYLSKHPGDHCSPALEDLIDCLEGGGEIARWEVEAMTLSGFMTLEEISHYGYAPKALILTSSLRYCHRCLGLGFHSMLYQHGAVTLCPYHRTPLLDICVDCKRPWKPTASQIVSSPYTCPSCQWLFWRSVAPEGAAEELDGAIRAVTDCWHDLRVEERVNRERVDLSLFDENLRPEARTATSVRRIQRATAWPKRLNHPWQRFKDTHLEVGKWCRPREADARRPTWEEVAEIPTETLKWLVDESDAPVAQSLALVESSWQRIQYITPLHRDRQLGVVATALHMTMCRYGWQRIDYRSAMQRREDDQPYAYVAWNGTRSESTPLNFGTVTGFLVSSEILGYFVLCLLRCAGLRPLSAPVGDPGTANYVPADYCPAWLFFRSSRTGWAIRFRKRATKKLVRWLLKRYRDKPLQRMVSCSWNSSPVFQELESLKAPEYAQELLQFPRKVAPPKVEEIT